MKDHIKAFKLIKQKYVGDKFAPFVPFIIYHHRKSLLKDKV